MGVQVLLISTDSKFVHKNWHDFELCNIDCMKDCVPFPMLTDPGGVLGDVYGAYVPAAGVDIRATVVIDPDGVVNWLSVNVPPLGRNADEIIRGIQALQEHAKTGKVVPASWTPGKETLDPSYENSGKIWRTLKK